MRSYYGRKRFSFSKFLVYFIIIGFILDLSVYFSQKNEFSLSPIFASFTPQSTPLPTPSPTPSPPPSSGLKNAVSAALDGSHGSYGIFIKNLKTGESYTQNENQTFESGSLYKLWVMAVVYEQLKQGQLKDDQVLSQDAATLNKEFDIDPGSAEQTSGTITYSVDDALTKMITISDNYAAMLLTEKVKLSSVAKFLQVYGFNRSLVGTNGQTPVTTASDIALFYQKLYSGELADPTYTQKMLDLLKNQALNEKIPQYLPNNVDIAHKTGELDDDSHDAGIVYGPSGDYIIVVLSESDDPQLANERIAEISKNVYNYFND